MDLRAGIMQSAGALGVNPLDLATAISYETAGTFDPRKAGPKTQWGQHRGLIQFGEPQAQKYGVNWEDPIGSQLGEGGAVVRYLKDTGVQPGMGLLDIYSAINAGGVGRFDASDANNGGAPGTVRDKVENQMADHRRKAAQMLNTPQSVAADTMTALGQPPRQENEQMNLLGLSTQGQFRADPPQQKEPWWNADRRDRLVMGLEGMTLNPNQGLMAAAQAGLQERAQGRKDGAKEQQNTERRNRTAQWLAERGREDLAQAVAGGMIDAKTAVSEAMKPPAESYRQVTGDEARDMGLDPSKVYNVGGNGRISGIGGGDTNVNVGTEKMSPGWKKIDETFGADQYVPWVSGGGSDAIKQIGQLRGVVDRLQAGEPITGPAIGMQPDALQSIFSPGALDAKQRVQEVVQRNLRTILGAQFTEKEGKALIERAFDQRLQPEQNAARLSALVMQMESAAQSKTAMVEYFNENGTLQGFNGAGYIPSMADFEALFDRFDARDGLGKPAQGGDYPDAPQVGAVVDGYRFNGGNPADQSNWSEAQ